MSKRQRSWARLKTKELKEKLGNKCSHCGTKKELTFDVIVPINDDHHRKMERSWRISFYRKQFDTNNLQLLCVFCNSKKGDKMELTNLIQTPY
jgi:5-methylcytosine-specific restriction endonuclease McrA